MIINLQPWPSTDIILSPWSIMKMKTVHWFVLLILYEHQCAYTHTYNRTVAYPLPSCQCDLWCNQNIHPILKLLLAHCPRRQVHQASYPQDVRGQDKVWWTDQTPQDCPKDWIAGCWLSLFKKILNFNMLKAIEYIEVTTHNKALKTHDNYSTINGTIWYTLLTRLGVQHILQYSKFYL